VGFLGHKYSRVKAIPPFSIQEVSMTHEERMKKMQRIEALLRKGGAENLREALRLTKELSA